ncbi:branched-chain amino acid ABC transporter permease [Nocardioides sp. Root190]|uniref:branched-chain amino acid ABC transporter permease n=1 Tax=Nocardioides sp. Root190 TaxID=1736488 RepID=UPI000700AD3E|nr:branched-chain amino acid ABC transporter permease [Nocardioides sp. Root190]KRB78675.1 branched-chain amino acid ABC transporter permease [Nocardioides sp. Root190]
MSTPLRTRGTPWGRPELYTSYRQDMALLNTRSKALGAAVVLVVAALLPMLISDDLLILLGGGLVLAIGAIGLNLVTGYAGQVSLGHAFFVGVGAYAAAVLSGDPDGRYLGFGIDFMPAWMLGAGLIAALCGALVAPLATRLRGLYLAIVTLGLVFIGQYFFFEWNEMSGGPQVGREAAEPHLFGIEFTVDNGFKGGWTEEQKLYWLFLAVLVIAAVVARNIARSRIGRAFQAIRDRDVAAGVMGVNLTRYKIIAFTISSFYAGIAGSLMFSASGHFTPESFSLLMSVQFIAIVLIGGVATISGTIMGAMLIALLPRIASELPSLLPFLSSSASEHPNIFEFEQIMYGVLIVAFLLFEPRGLFGIWHRLRTYWKSFPFSY